MRRILLALPLTGLATLATAAQERPEEKSPWEGAGELGIATASGNTDSSTFTASLQGDRESEDEKLTLHLLGKGRYAQEEGEATSQRAQGTAQLDYAFSARDYAYGLFDASHAKFSGYDLRLQEGAGLGRKFFLDKQTLDWRVEGGPSLRQDWGTDDSYETTPNARLRTLFEWAFRENANLSQELTWIHGLDDIDRYTASAQTALSLKINTQLALKTSLEVEHNSQPPDDRERTDIYTTTSLLYSF